MVKDPNGGMNSPAQNASLLTPSLDPEADHLAFSAAILSASTPAVCIYHDEVKQAEIPALNLSFVSSELLSPTQIVSTGKAYFSDFVSPYFGPATSLARVKIEGPSVSVSGTQNVNDVAELVSFDPSTTLVIQHIQELTFVPDEAGGAVYFLADLARSGVVQEAAVLCSMRAESVQTVAYPVLTPLRQHIQGAHHLGAVHRGEVSRLYFSAPVSPTQNSEYAAGGKDYGMQPWVVNVQ